MNQLTRLLAPIACAVATAGLFSCGGGSGSGSDSSAPDLTPPPVARKVDFTFFGQSDPAVTAAYTSVYHAVDWGAWAFPAQDIELRMIAEMQAARARGVDKFVLSTGFLTFDKDCNWIGTTQLSAFKLQLDALDLSRSVWMLYPMDEPDVHGCSDSTMQKAFSETRAAWGGEIKVGVIYGPNGSTPGVSSATDVGRDDYGHGPQVVSIRADQSLMIVAGGANGDNMREDPKRFVDYAATNPQVSLVWAFLYVDYVDPKGHPQLGIANNGMLPAYRAAGCSLTEKCQ